MMLAFMLARKGVTVTLLEARRDFERGYRGNMINPGTMRVLEDLGLAEGVLELPHTRVDRFLVGPVGGGPAEQVAFADFSRLREDRPYALMLPQSRFLDYVAREGERRFGKELFRIVMGATVTGLLEENGATCGVRYRADGGQAQELGARLTVGTDGRFSKVRRLSGLGEGTRRSSPPMDVLWFDLPREPSDPEGVGALFRIGRGVVLALMDHGTHWQVGYMVKKGGERRFRGEAGLEEMRRAFAAAAPELSDRAHLIRRWELLPVAADCLKRWWRPGLLLLGDAAHVVSPVGGVGINLAVQDAVVTANLLAGTLKADAVPTDRELNAVERRRKYPTRIVQAVQELSEPWIIKDALDPTTPPRLPRSFRAALSLPLIGALPTRLIAYGAWHVRPR